MWKSLEMSLLCLVLVNLFRILAFKLRAAVAE